MSAGFSWKAWPPPLWSGVPLASVVFGFVYAGSAPVPMFKIKAYLPVLNAASELALEILMYTVLPAARSVALVYVAVLLTPYSVAPAAPVALVVLPTTISTFGLIKLSPLQATVAFNVVVAPDGTTILK